MSVDSVVTGRLPEPGSVLDAGVRLIGWSLGAPPAAFEPIAEETWPEFFSLLTRHRITGILLAAHAAGDAPLTDPQLADVRALDQFLTRRVLALELLLLQVGAVLDAAAIETRVLKGAALAHTVYPDPGQRLYVDVDLLVRSRDLDRTIAELTAAGFARAQPEPRPGFVSRYGKSVELKREDGYSIDLHRALAPGVWAVLMEPDDLFATGSPFRLAGRDFVGLGPEEQFVHACYHLTVGNEELVLQPLRDLPMTLLRDDLDLDRVIRLAQSWHAEVVVASAVALTWALLPGLPPCPLAAWAETVRPDEGALRRLDLAFEGDHSAAEVRAMLGALGSARAKGGYLAALLFPSKEYLAHRGQRPRDRWTRGMHLLGDRLRIKGRQTGD